MADKNHLKKIEYVSQGSSIPALCDATLYITDSPELACTMTNLNYPVAAHIHEGNKDFSFNMVRYLVEDPDIISFEDYEHIYNRICALPCTILETDRILVRETTIADLEELFALYKDPEVTRYMEDLFEPEKEIAYQLDYIDKIYGLYDIGIWSLISKSSGMLIGRMGIEYTDEENYVEMGFMLGKEYRHQGYATEAGRSIINYARELPGVSAVRAKIHKDNVSSISLCKKLGFTEVSFDPDKELTIWELEL